jgi:hypothetical protein
MEVSILLSAAKLFTAACSRRMRSPVISGRHHPRHGTGHSDSADEFQKPLGYDTARFVTTPRTAR